MIGSCATLTLMFSAAGSGRWAKKGRRQLLIISAVIGIVGTAITIWENMWAIIFGRMIYGISVGMIAIAMPRLMDETVPLYLQGFYGGIYCLSFAAATLLAYTLAIPMPQDDDKQGLIDSIWPQITFGMPIVFYILQLIL